MPVQSVMFDKRNGWNSISAKEWLTSHGFKAEKIDEKKNFLRARQFPPTKSKGSFITSSLRGGSIKLVIWNPTNRN